MKRDASRKIFFVSCIAATIGKDTTKPSRWLLWPSTDATTFDMLITPELVYMNFGVHQRRVVLNTADNFKFIKFLAQSCASGKSACCRLSYVSGSQLLSTR